MSASNANGSLRRRRRRPSQDDNGDDDGDNDDDGRHDDAATNPPKPKRMRPSVGGDDVSSFVDDNDVSDDVNETYYSAHDGSRRAGAEASGGADSGPGSSRPAFQRGAIVRVLVENFVTYERAEFNPGPSLNMVIGPNGTGKSSLVCAICLGLGFHSNVLGRASAFGDFVKHGRAFATVEIELQKGPQDRRNAVVRLRINREDNSRRFWLNGRDAPLRKIQAFMQDLRIQVDNLCQFLPQDRVAEFAGLNAVDLLAKTLEAAAPPEMKKWQSDLKDIYRAQKDAQHQIKIDGERLRLLESRHQAQQADVERFREREEIQHAIDDLTACRPLVRFYAARAKYNNHKRQRRTAERELKALQSRLEPTLQAVDRKKEYQDQLEQGLARRKDRLRHTEHLVGRAASRIERIDEEVKDAKEQHSAHDDLIDNKKKELGSTRKKITMLEAKLKNRPPEFVAADWNMKIREKEHQRREIEAEKREIHDNLERIRIQGARLQEEKQQFEKEIAVLDSRRGQQLSLLKRIAPEVARGWQWLDANKDKFSKEIFGPPMVTCAVKDRRYSNLVQSLLQNDDFLCFTTQSVQDHKKLSDQFYEVMGLSVTIRTCTTPFDSFRPPLAPDELAAMGFDGLAVDYLEGPEPVLAMLCAERRLHCSPVSLESPRPDQYDLVVANDKISTWASKDQSYRVNRRREYGAHAVSTAVRDIRPGRYWTEAAQADMSEKNELQAQLNEVNEKLRTLQEERQAVRNRAAEPARNGVMIDEEIERLREEKNQLQAEYSRWCALPEKIQVENSSLSRIREEYIDLVNQRLQQMGVLDELVLQRARAVVHYAEQVATLRDAYLAVMDAQMRLLEAASDVRGLEERNVHLTGLLAEREAAVAQLAEDMRAEKREGEAALLAAQDVADEGSERSVMLHALAKTKTPEDLENEVAAERAKLELTRVVDASVLEAFRRRGKDIDQLRAALAAHESGYADMSRQVADIRGQWEPRLDELIGRINDAFSYNFEQINCAGEVSVHKDEDFDKWAIEIRVKFRENEELQKLDQHRQSGGERAVSTIFYLMSLQGMAQAPFRVVDEINQGMDPRNERMMHERMVEIACHEHASQYFLITPKLLPGLRYDENMTVLCIASGQHVPNNEAKLDFRKCMQIQRRLLAAA
ncbi:structural maintenance of chromosome complex subunit [Niveomyces insectorum RCEF 264]|uniref:Structural maintenance of chromosomes protein 5 n=1 Tax=Niveomyces insectorum RCEF 264 TaxID=1081102 RepID=A0A167VDW5_9HYPO|nr:structural maintenance of chromosome complex subunit [Niveomyces insectorum RCEF 264]